MMTEHFTSGIRPNGDAILIGKDSDGVKFIMAISSITGLKEIKEHLKWIEREFRKSRL